MVPTTTETKQTELYKQTNGENGEKANASGRVHTGKWKDGMRTGHSTGTHAGAGNGAKAATDTKAATAATPWESLMDTAVGAVGAKVVQTDLRLSFLRKAQLCRHDQNTPDSDVPAFHDFSLDAVKSWKLVFTKHAYSRARGTATQVHADGGGGGGDHGGGGGGEATGPAAATVASAEKPRDEVLAVRRCMTGGVHGRFVPLIRHQPDTGCCIVQFHDCRFVAVFNLESKSIVVVTILPMYPRSRTEPVVAWSGFLKTHVAADRAAKVAKSVAASAREAGRKAAKRSKPTRAANSSSKAKGGGKHCCGKHAGDGGGGGHSSAKAKSGGRAGTAGTAGTSGTSGGRSSSTTKTKAKGGAKHGTGGGGGGKGGRGGKKQGQRMQALTG